MDLLHQIECILAARRAARSGGERRYNELTVALRQLQGLSGVSVTPNTKSGGPERLYVSLATRDYSHYLLILTLNHDGQVYLTSYPDRKEKTEQLNCDLEDSIHKIAGVIAEALAYHSRYTLGVK